MRDSWQNEAHEAKQRENWALHGPNRPVKVLRFSFVGASAGGYFTLAKFIKGLTPYQIEKALGLEINSLKNGANICTFKRLPQLSEYAYELTADRPDGLAATFMSHPFYPAGSGKIPQWRIHDGIAIPIINARADRLYPDQKFIG